MKNEKYFFCYSGKLAYFLIEVKGLKYITKAKRYQDDIVFTLFEKDEQLKKALDEYDKLK
ncbi:hypothetical protein [Lentibacillus cibarius]|uniref:DUF5659 domain-containing protein n=1 Tax=Lentibacillus cibarius TaxID=2583219 RepID=A0A5S3QN00_9BACI|nr:hypothetical protein [Lentibacillus cibarius]TMN23159.1 hypothetical protein FFL34_14475 [Lentibacillus cibarius]